MLHVRGRAFGWSVYGCVRCVLRDVRCTLRLRRYFQQAQAAFAAGNGAEARRFSQLGNGPTSARALDHVCAGDLPLMLVIISAADVVPVQM